MIHKKCKRCGQEKPLEEFYPSKKCKDGYRNVCSPCFRKQANQRQSLYSSRHPKRIKAKNRAYKQNNPEKVKLLKIKRRDQEKATNTTYDATDQAIVSKVFGKRCFNCGAKEKLTLDHIFALSTGNGLSVVNACLLCASCNSSKCAKPINEFYQPKKQAKLIGNIYRAYFRKKAE